MLTKHNSFSSKLVKMFCAISGEVPSGDAVVSRSSGLLFDKKLLLSKFTSDNGPDYYSCPITHTTLSVHEDLINVKAVKSVKPRPANAHSIPAMLSLFQNEWDEVVLETFTLRQHLEATRQELAQALYQHEAACRTIARLMVERDQALQMVQQLTANGFVKQAEDGTRAAAIVEDAEMDTSAPAVASLTTVSVSAESSSTPPSAVIQSEISDKCKELSGGRKARRQATEKAIVPKDELSSLSAGKTFSPHKSDKSTTVTCVAAKSIAPGSGYVLSGSTDKTAIITNLASGKVVSKLSGHTKKITAVSFVDPFHINSAAEADISQDCALAFTASADKSVKLWKADFGSGKYKESFSFNDHQGEVTGISIHPTGKYFVSTTTEGSWNFLDFSVGSSIRALNAGVGLTSCSFHPDGLILSTGTEAGVLQVWDVRDAALNPASVCEGHTAALGSITFSENGYLVATASLDNTVRIWDLRKQICLQTFEVGSNPASSVAFDASGSYLAIGGGGDTGGDLQIKTVKDWQQLVTLPKAHSKAVSGVAWTDSKASGIVSCSLDRTIKVHST